MAKQMKNAIGAQFEAYLFGRMKLSGMKQKELAGILNMTPETLRKRTRSPWLFVVEDVTKMAGALGVPAENLFALSMGKKRPLDDHFLL